MPSGAGFLEPRGSKLGPLKWTFYAENFSARAQSLKKHQKTLYFKGSRSFKVINVEIMKKLVTSACYDKQYVCTYLQLFSR